MSVPRSHSQALDQLQAMVNATLIQVGRAFNDSRSNPRAAVITNGRLKQIIPATLERYHEALDELEKELARAKLVMRRDIALCEASRSQRPRPGASGAPMVAETMTSSVQNQKHEERSAPEAIKLEPDIDVGMRDQPALQDSSDVKQENGESKLSDREPEQSQEQIVGPKTDNSITVAESKKLGDQASEEKLASETLEMDTQALPQPAEGTRNSVSDDGAPRDTTRDADQNFNFADIHFDGTQGANDELFGPEPNDEKPASPRRNTDLITLLPGLETYANAAGALDDFGGVDLDEAMNRTTLQRGEANATAHMEAGNQMAESDFNDWFNSIDMDAIGVAGQGGGGNSTVNDSAFDEEWFHFDQK